MIPSRAVHAPIEQGPHTDGDDLPSLESPDGWVLATPEVVALAVCGDLIVLADPTGVLKPVIEGPSTTPCGCVGPIPSARADLRPIRAHLKTGAQPALSDPPEPSRPAAV